MTQATRRPPIADAAILWTGFIASAGLQLAAALAWSPSQVSDVVLAARIQNLVVILVPTSMGLSLILRFSFSRRMRTAILAFRILVVFIVVYAAGRNVLIPLLLVFSLICECVIYLDFWLALVGSFAAVFLTVLSCGNVSLWTTVLAPVPPPQVVALVVANTAFIAVGLLFRRYHDLSRRREISIHHLDRTVDALTSANKGFQRYAIDAELRAAEAERNRIVRELHDSIGYTLTNVVIMSRVAQRVASVEQVDLKELLETICGQAQSGLTEMRSTLRILRAGEPVRPRGMEAIRQLAMTFEQSTGVEVRVESTNVRWDPDSPVDASIFRIVQESLTNSFRHGHARHVLLQFWQDQSGLSLNIEDDGNAPTDGEVGLGLAGMEERVRDLHGTFSATGSRFGFSVRVWFPAGRPGGTA